MSLAGKTVVFTGTLSMKRADAKSMAEAAGAKVGSTITGKTDIVVAGADAGSKLDSAKALKITVWTEAEFIKEAKGGATAPAATAAPTPTKSLKATPPPKPVVAPPVAAPPAATPPAATPPAATPPVAVTPAPPAPPAAAAVVAAAKPVGHPVDREVPDRANFKVHEDFSVTLNQTNIDGNNNKFYIIQALEGSGGKFFVWSRWGRVGESGQHKLEQCGNSAAAIKGFEQKFKDKTVNSWDSRFNFVKHDGKYQLVDTDDTAGEGSSDGAAPMGTLSKAQIEKGQEVLSDLMKEVQGKAQKASLNSLSSQFFSLIPTNFGRHRPEPITTEDGILEKEELLKFYLRMGFEEVHESQDAGSLLPISGVMDMALPATLLAACMGICDKGSVSSSVNLGDKLHQKKAGAPHREMNKELYGAIMLYTSNAIYSQLNQVLREEKRTQVRKYFPYLRMLLEATARLPTNAVRLWRGVSVDLSKQYEVGSTITWWGVSSCTSDEAVARGFAGSCGGNSSFLTIDTKTACDISKITFYSNEKESLLLPGTQLKVVKSAKQGKVAHIHLEEVGRLVG